MNEYDIGIGILSIVFGLWQYWNIRHIFKLRKALIQLQKSHIKNQDTSKFILQRMLDEKKKDMEEKK